MRSSCFGGASILPNTYAAVSVSTGVGTAVAFGRIGNVLAVYVGGYALDHGGPPGYFTSWAILMALVFLSLAIIGRHVPKSAIAGAPATASTH